MSIYNNKKCNIIYCKPEIKTIFETHNSFTIIRIKKLLCQIY